MAGPRAYMDELKVHVFDFSFAEGWVVMTGTKVLYG
jgi:hypothetical protein